MEKDDGCMYAAGSIRIICLRQSEYGRKADAETGTDIAGIGYLSLDFSGGKLGKYDDHIRADRRISQGTSGNSCKCGMSGL